MASGIGTGLPPQPPTTPMPDAMHTDNPQVLPMPQDWNSMPTNTYTTNSNDPTYNLHQIVLLFHGPYIELWNVMLALNLPPDQSVMLHIDFSHSLSTPAPIVTEFNNTTNQPSNPGHIPQGVNSWQKMPQTPTNPYRSDNQSSQEVPDNQMFQHPIQTDPVRLAFDPSDFSNDHAQSYDDTNASAYSPLTSTIPPTTPLPTTPYTSTSYMVPIASPTEVKSPFLSVPESSAAASQRQAMQNRNVRSSNRSELPRRSMSHIRPRPRPGRVVPISPELTVIQERQPKIADAAWDIVWPRVTEKYLREEDGGENCTLAEVRRTIKDEYGGFEPTIAQYKKQLDKRNVTKNRPREA